MNPVLLATDGSPTAGKASDTAIELAQLLGTELVVVCVWDIAYTTVGLAPLPITAHEDAGVQARAVVLRGQPVGQICRAAETHAPRFLVIGSHGWRALKRALFGSVSTGVLHHATCPVVVVRGEAREVATAERRGEPAYA